MQALVESISHALQSCGWHVDVNNNVLEARRDAIKASWWFGSRRVRSSLRCVFDEKNTVLDYQELAWEVSVGLPPPTLSFSHWKQTGLKVDIDRTDLSLTGGGTLHYGQARKLLEQACRQHGWELQARLLIDIPQKRHVL